MAIPWYAILEERAACPIHIQAAVVGVSLPAAFPGRARVQLETKRCFRGDVPEGRRFTISVEVFDREDIILEGDAPYTCKELQSTWMLEVCLRADGTLPFNSCSARIHAPSDQPVLELAAPKAKPEPPGSWWARLFRRSPRR